MFHVVKRNYWFPCCIARFPRFFESFVWFAAFEPPGLPVSSSSTSFSCKRSHNFFSLSSSIDRFANLSGIVAGTSSDIYWTFNNHSVAKGWWDAVWVVTSEMIHASDKGILIEFWRDQGQNQTGLSPAETPPRAYMPILCWSFFDKVCFRTWTRNEWSCASWWPSLRLISKANSAILILPEQGVEWMSKSPTSNPLMSNHSDWRRQKVFNDSWSPFWYHITIFMSALMHNLKQLKLWSRNIWSFPTICIVHCMKYIYIYITISLKLSKQFGLVQHFFHDGSGPTT